jgi:hypothetical protein
MRRKKRVSAESVAESGIRWHCLIVLYGASFILSHDILLNAGLNRRFDVLVKAKEVLWVVLLLDGHKPGVVGPESGFNRVFPLLT